jgi:LPS export ABC transporter protein LptC
MWLGLGLLASFFILSAVVIYQRNSMRLPAKSGSLSKEEIEGIAPAQLSPAAIIETPPGTPGGGLGFVLNEFHRSLVRDGKTVWEIRGERGKYDPTSNKAKIDKPDLNVVRDNGDTIHLTADRADLLLSGTQLSTAELFDNVVVVYKGTTTLKTTRALYDEQQGRVEIPVPLELDSPMFALTGNKLVAYVDPQEIFITNGVTSVIKPRNK